MSKILIEGNKVIIEGHASDLETCNTLTNLCDELSTSEKFRTVKYESGYGEFESISESEEKKFAADFLHIYVYSNDGATLLVEDNRLATDCLVVVSDGIIFHPYYDSSDTTRSYTYSGSKKFMGISQTVGATSADFPVGSSQEMVDAFGPSGTYTLYIVEADPGYQVNIQSNDGTTILSQNATIDSVVVTATGAQLKCGDAVKDTYTYSGSKMFAGLSTSANATVPQYKSGDTIEITAETTFYIVENIIIPEHHSSLNELFTNIANVIRSKMGSTDPIVADSFPSAINEIETFKPEETFNVIPTDQVQTIVPSEGKVFSGGTIEAVPTETKIVTANGTVVTPTSGKFLSSVTVSIPEYDGSVS